MSSSRSASQSSISRLLEKLIAWSAVKPSNSSSQDDWSQEIESARKMASGRAAGRRSAPMANRSHGHDPATVHSSATLPPRSQPASERCIERGKRQGQPDAEPQGKQHRTGPRRYRLATAMIWRQA